jgi:hypothetical protein
MRSPSWARWATCALALSICVPALADSGRKKTLATCTSLDENDKGEDQVELAIHNSCSVPIDCTISWRVVCAPKSAKRRAVHAGSSKLQIHEGATGAADASAAVCGDDSWTIEGIEWACQPNND